jgi:hypothetical protein
MGHFNFIKKLANVLSAHCYMYQLNVRYSSPASSDGKLYPVSVLGRTVPQTASKWLIIHGNVGNRPQTTKTANDFNVAGVVIGALEIGDLATS